MTSEVLWTQFPEAVLITYGAKLNYLIDAPNYQWWRLIAPMFIHINLIHLMVNMYSLMMVGPFVEKLYGSAKFVVFWVATGICGLVASYLTVRPHLATSPLTRFIFKGVDVPSAGASGALFGLVGVLFVFGIKFRHELPEGFKRAFGTGMLPIIFINLMIGFIGSAFIDNAAHLGGFLSGAVLAGAMEYRRPGVRSSVTTIWRVLQILSLSVVILGFYKVVRNFNRTVVHEGRVLPNANTLIFLNYVNAMNQVQEKVSTVIHQNDRSGIAVVTDRAVQAPVPDAQAGELRTRLVVILSKLAEAQTPQADPKLVAEYEAWRKEYNVWLKQTRAR